MSRPHAVGLAVAPAQVSALGPWLLVLSPRLPGPCRAQRTRRGKDGPQPGGGQGAHRDQPTSPRARAWSTFNGKYCHCRGELRNGQVFFYFNVESQGRAWQGTRVPVPHKMEGTCGRWACSLCPGNWKGSSRSSVLFQRLGPPLELILFPAFFRE